MHHAFANTQAGFLVAQHRGCIQNALMQGIRGFMLDVHITSSGNILLCHVSCPMGSATVSGTLEIFRQFIVQNPREIVTIFWEFGYDMRSDPNSHDDDKIELRHQLNVAMHKSNLTAFVYAHHTMYFVQWPTLQEMIGMDKRLVVFTDSRFHIRNSWETSIQKTIQTSFQLSDINALKTGCPMSGFRLSRTLVVVNHFVTLGALGINGISTNILASVFHVKFFANINKFPFFAKRILLCMKDSEVFPSFIAVDFWESSDVVQVVDMINSNFYVANYSWVSVDVATVGQTLGCGNLNLD